MSYTNAEGRQEVLDELAGAVEDISLALATLGEAYEQLDEATADRLEDELFRPLQLASGQAQRTYIEFAGRHGFRSRAFDAPPHVHTRDAKGAIEAAAAIVGRADLRLAELQDSMLPIEVGDPQLRAGLEQVRVLLGDSASRSRKITRIIGR